MILNYHTLSRWAQEMKPELVSAKIVDVFCQTKDVLHIGLVTANREPCHIEISTESRYAHLVLRRLFQRRPKNSAGLFASAVGQKISDMRLRVHDRVIDIELSGGDKFIIEAFGSVNVFLISSDAHILESFHDSKTRAGTAYVQPKRSESMHDSDFKSFRKEIKTQADFQDRLTAGLFHFNKTLAMELLPDMTSQPGDALRHCFEAARKLLDRLNHDRPRIYWLRDEPKMLSVAELTHWKEKHPDAREELFDSVNEAIAVYVTHKLEHDIQKKKIDALLGACKTRIRKNRSLIAVLSKEKIKAEDYRRIEQTAHLLNIHISQIKRGAGRLRVTDTYGKEGATVEIELDPALTPQDNISRYFSRARKLKNSVHKIAGRILELEKENGELLGLESSVEKWDRKKIEKIHEQFVRSGQIKKTETRFKFDKEETPAFKNFVVTGNWRVLVGQNDLKNDLLTFKFAKGDDWWFHARGVPGSHVVLKRDGRRDNPSDRAIESAASIAAYFSKAKTSGLVPVVYTKKKFVRKPKGAKSGQVIIEREEVVIVPPKEPKTKPEDP